MALPHGISLARAALGLVFPLAPADWWPWLALVAALSDYADGAASRLLGVAGKVGQWLDPLADKCFLLGAMIALLRSELLSPAEAIFFCLRDLMAALGVGYLLLRQDRPRLTALAPTFLGKLTTALQLMVIVLLLFQIRSRELIVGVAILSGAAGLDYLRRYGPGVSARR